MAQAILIIAHRDFDHLIDIIDWFDNDFEFYIHIDKKSKPDEDVLNRIRSNKKVRFVGSHYTISWGGINYLNACFLLAEKALENPTITYFHTISGQDFPVNKVSAFKDLERLGKDYMTHYKMPMQQWESGGFERVDYYHLYDVFNVKTKQGQWIERFIRLQKFLKFKRSYSSDLPALYGGDSWFSLSRNTMNYLIKYTKEQPAFFNRLKHSKLSDEYYFHSIVMSSPYANNLINDNLRYIDWESGRSDSPAHPANLDETDFMEVTSGKYLFARKFLLPVSTPLKALLINHHNG